MQTWAQLTLKDYFTFRTKHKKKILKNVFFLAGKERMPALRFIFVSAVQITTLKHVISSDSPEIQPKFVKGSKRYGRRSTPEFIKPISELPELRNANLVGNEVQEDNCDSAVPRKREVKNKTCGNVNL